MNTEMTSSNNGLICLAIDATGPQPDDEILSASIVDAGGLSHLSAAWSASTAS